MSLYGRLAIPKQPGNIWHWMLHFPNRSWEEEKEAGKQASGCLATAYCCISGSPSIDSAYIVGYRGLRCSQLLSNEDKSGILINYAPFCHLFKDMSVASGSSWLLCAPRKRVNIFRTLELENYMSSMDKHTNRYIWLIAWNWLLISCIREQIDCKQQWCSCVILYHCSPFPS